MAASAGPVIDGTRMADGAISPKAKLAAVFAALATVLTVVGHTIATGEFNATEIGELVVGLAGAAAAFAGGYKGKPGPVVPAKQAPPSPGVGTTQNY